VRSPATIDEVTIEERFHGPPRSGNGGYTCGVLAASFHRPMAVRLSAPPPLATPLRREIGPEHARLYDRETVIAEARIADLDLEVPEPPTFAEAETASLAYPGFERHPFPTCFVCGPQRAGGDGLRIFAGPVEGRDIVAAPWIPDASLADEGSGAVRREFLWAALDCPSAYALPPLEDGLAIVLGELTGEISGILAPGERCTLIGWFLGVEGRKRRSASAIFGPRGGLVAKARATWIAVPADMWA
jgi:hypothetical protein